MIYLFQLGVGEQMQENIKRNKSNVFIQPILKDVMANKMAGFCFCLLVFFIIITPRIFQIPKIILLVLIIISLLLAKGGFNFKRANVFNAIWLNLLFCVIGTLVAIININKDIFSYAKVNFLWYLLLIVLFFQFEKEILHRIIRTIIWASVYIFAYSILLIFHVAGIINLPFLLLLDATANVGFHSGYIHIVSTNLSMLMFTMPIIFSLIIYAPDRFLSKIKFKRKSLIIILLLNFLTMFLSGRRIMWLNILFSAILFGLLKFSSGHRIDRRRRITLLGSVFIIILAIFILLLNTGILERFFEIFSNSDNIRFVQIQKLWKGFLQNPFLGTGFGHEINTIPGYEGTTIVEVTYNLMLYNTGIIGTMLYVIYILKIIQLILKEIKKNNYYKPLLIGVLVGFMLIIFNTATNPYMTSSFDFHIFQIFPLWIIYLSQKTKNSYTQHIKIKGMEKIYERDCIGGRGGDKVVPADNGDKQTTTAGLR